MKKCINFLMLVVVAVMFVSCGGDTALKMQIESGQKHCPMNLGMAGKLTSMSYNEDDKEVDFLFTVNPQVMDVKAMEADPENTKNTLRLSLSKGDMKKLLQMMVDAGASLKVTYKNRGKKDEFVTTFSADELKNILDNPMSEEETNKLILSSQIKSERNKLPYNIEKGLKVTDIQDNGAMLTYVCEVDEDLYELDEMGAAKEELKGNMRKMLKDRSMRQQAEILASLNKGFEYKYVGVPSGKSVVVSFSAAELEEIGGKKK